MKSRITHALVLFSLFVVTAALADMKIQIPDGRTVLLKDNGTWEFVSEAADKQTQSASESTPEAVVTKLYNEVVTKLKNNENFNSSNDTLRDIWTQNLHAMMSRADKRERGEDDYEPDYQFLPGNGGPDGFKILGSEVKSGIASVSVGFFFTENPDDDAGQTVVLLEKQEDGRWLVSNFFEVYEGKLSEGALSDIAAALSASESSE